MSLTLVVVLALAVLVGVSLGLLGGGGSILTVPLLVYVAGMPTKEAITASLFVVGVTSVAGAIGHARAGRVRWRTGLVFGAAGMAGAVVGLVTGLVGAGGGFLVVPALTLLGGMSMSAAVGTSLLVIAMKSFAGLGGYLTTVQLDWPLVLGVTVAAVVGSVLGGRLVGRFPEATLRKGFGMVRAGDGRLRPRPPGAGLGARGARGRRRGRAGRRRLVLRLRTPLPAATYGSRQPAAAGFLLAAPAVRRTPTGAGFWTRPTRNTAGGASVTPRYSGFGGRLRG